MDHPERTVPHRPGLETGAAAGMMDGSRRPLSAFEPEPRRDVPPVRVPPLPRPKPRSRRWLCILCGDAADDPRDLCEPVSVS